MINLHPIEILPNATKEIILNQLSKKNDIKDLIKIFTPNQYYQDEVYQELFLYLCEMNDDKLIDIYLRSKLNGYVIGYIKKSLKYDDSMFFYKIKNHDNKVQDINHKIDEYLDLLVNEYDFSTELKHLFLDQYEIEMNNLPYYDKNILIDYLKLGTIKAVSQKTKISSNYISQSLAETKKILKKTILDNIKKIQDNKL